MLEAFSDRVQDLLLNAVFHHFIELASSRVSAELIHLLVQVLNFLEGGVRTYQLHGGGLHA